MSYLVLARKYRPKQFSDMVGQTSVVRTLTNAIKMNRAHHAYVFSGSRGIGKTSIARIFSKVLRCAQVQDQNGILVSCDHCSDCLEIAAGTSVDVLEIDGASNNGVDSIREIRDGAKFLPSSGTKKIYIIDEVHMLSTAAFNALLKTLEEPPEHIVFIFATTEPHKIPETILGRCQRFDFKRVTVDQIVERIKSVLNQEKIAFEDAALQLIGRSSEGSMRDALSLLDQVISFSQGKITAESVRESIGLIGTELVLEFVEKLLKREANQAMSILSDAFKQGVDLKVLLRSVIEVFHALILLQAGVEKLDVAFTNDEIKRIRSLEGVRSIEETEVLFQFFHHGLDLVARSPQPKLVFDVLIVKAALAQGLAQVEVLPTTQTRVAAPIQSQHAEVISEPLPVVREPKETKSAPSLSSSSGLGLGKHFQKSSVAAATEPPPVSTFQAASFEEFIRVCAQKKPMLAILLESVVEPILPTRSGEPFRLGFRSKDQTRIDQVNQKAHRDSLIEVGLEVFKERILFETFVSTLQGESPAERQARLLEAKKNAKLKEALEHPAVAESKTLFGAEVLQVVLHESSGAGGES